jgi:orotate phosphoribosyltransferase
MSISMSNLVFAGIIKGTLRLNNAFWVYQGLPRKNAPHVLLTSGKHSDGYVNIGKVLKEKSDVRREFAGYIVTILSSMENRHFNWVVGADTSSTDLAREVAKTLRAGHIKMVKTQDGKVKKQVWDSRNLLLKNGDVILQVEDLITTAGSALQVREGIRLANPGVEVRFAPLLPVLVDRSDPHNRVTMVEESEILPLLQLSIGTYKAGLATCVYCAAGSEAIIAKEGDNLDRLIG